MKKIIFTILIILAAWVVYVYALYYSIFNKMRFKIEGFSFKNEEGQVEVKKKMALKLGIYNNSRFNAKIKRVQVFVINQNKAEIGRIEALNNIEIPSHGDITIPIHLNSVDVVQLIADIATGKIKGYEYKVRVLFFGFLPFWYKSKLF